MLRNASPIAALLLSLSLAGVSCAPSPTVSERPDRKLFAVPVAPVPPPPPQPVTPSADSVFEPPRPTRPDPFTQRYPPDTALAAGQPIATGTRVVLFTEPAGFNAYQTPAYYGPRVDRFHNGTPDLPRDEAVRVAKQGYTFDALKQRLDQIVLHYDATGLASDTFRVLRERGLSAHFLIDLDGTIYQTLDLEERAWHARESNSRSIGIEIANIGAFPPGETDAFRRWYATDPFGQVTLRLPPRADLLSDLRPLAPARREPVVGSIHGRVLTQYDLTDPQYDALIQLTAALCRAFPRIKPKAPADRLGNVLDRSLSEQELSAFRGIVGHYHVTDHKIDPGPAFNWSRYLSGVREKLRE